jgi:NNP family nitrate/nitrite transporter-like MFS transporter
MLPFTIGALAVASAVGFGSGATFKLLPQYFPDAVGSATGIVAAVGALGGFFPPIVLGLSRTLAGTFAPGFICLSLFAIGCAVTCAVTIAPQRRVGELTDVESRGTADAHLWKPNLASVLSTKELT